MKKGFLFAFLCSTPFFLSGCGGAGAAAVAVLTVTGVIDEFEWELDYLGDEPLDPIVAEHQYKGRLDEAVLTEQNFGRFVTPFVLHPWLVGPYPEMKTLACSEGEGQVMNDLGVNNGARTGNGDWGTLNTVMDQCDIGVFIIDGSLSIELDDIDTDNDSIERMTYYFNGWRVQFADGRFIQYDGVVEVEGFYDCVRTTVSNISITTEVENDGALLEDFTIRSVCSDEETDYYSLTYKDVAGTIYLFDEGKVQIEIENGLFGKTRANYAAQGGFKEIGGYSFGVEFYSYLFDKDAYDPIFSASSENLIDGVMQLNNSTGNVELSATDTITNVAFRPADDSAVNVDEAVPTWFAFTPWALDFNDSDGDGMWNGWEQIYGLPLFVANADDNDDGDGVTNFEEFTFFSNPLDEFSGPAGEVNIRGSVPRDTAILSGQSFSFPIYLWGYFDLDFIPLSPTVDVVVELGAATDQWLFEPESDLGCELVNVDGRFKLVCNDLDSRLFSPAVSVSDQLPLGQLTIIGGTSSHEACALFTATADRPLRSRYRNPYEDPEYEWCITSAGDPQALVLESTSKAYVLEDLWVETLQYPLQLAPPTLAVTDQYRVRAQAADNDLSFSIRNISTSVNGADCELIDPQTFDCSGTLEELNEVVMIYSVPEVTGSVNIRWTFDAVYTDGRQANSQTQRTLAFGLSSEVLKNDINAAIADGEQNVILPAGVYVGGVQIDQPMTLDGSQGTQLWLTQSEYSGEDRSLPFVATAPLTIENMHIYLRDIGLSLRGGTIENSWFYGVGEQGTSVIDIAGSAESLRMNANDIRFTESDFRRVREGLDPLGIIRVVDDGSGGSCACEVTNNWVQAARQGASLVVDDISHNALSVPAEYTAVIANNTLIDVDHIVRLASPEGVYGLVANNVHFLNPDLPATPPLVLGDDNPAPEQVVDLRGNLLMTEASQQAEFNYVILPSLTVAELATPTSNSQTVDAGIDMSEWFTSDLEGATRPAGTGYDIGALEFEP